MKQYEIKNMRKKIGCGQEYFAELLGVNQSRLSKIELGKVDITPNIEAGIDRLLEEETTTIITKKIFSRDLFLKNMLTGNPVVDDIYLNATWLKHYDNYRVCSIGRRYIFKAPKDNYKFKKWLREKNIKNSEKIIISDWEFQYVLIYFTEKFFCKKEWLING